VRQLSNDINGRGVFLSPPRMFEAFLLDYLVVDGDILDDLEEWDFNT